MKKRKTRRPTPTRGRLSCFAQICNYIPGHLVAKVARETGVDVMARTFSAWSHVVAMLYAQLTHAIGLNDVCDGLRNHLGWLVRIRAATPPSRNGLSHANKHRDATMAEKLFWAVLAHLQNIQPAFARGPRYRGLAGRFKRTIHVVDSTTIHLMASCLDWAKHRRRKAAAKCHLRMHLQSMLPRFAIIGSANDNDNVPAHELCAGIRDGEIVLFDRAYVDFEHLFHLHNRGVFFVTRTKENNSFRVVKKRLRKREKNILRDDEVLLTVRKSRRFFPSRLRRILAEVEIDGELVELEFFTNNFEWSPATVADLYRCRWQIEVFFKQIKQTLQLCDFMGNSANAVRWQIWTALLLYVLLRFQASLHSWPHSFTRLFTLLRAVIWDRFDLPALLQFYGTAKAHSAIGPHPVQDYLPGLAPISVG